jgi:hypothetical protein
MFYGGTNWGTIGDPDVYTSYDYSACIREFGHFSGKGRELRLSMTFARCFPITRTVPHNETSRFSFELESSLDRFITGRRTQTGPQTLEFVFFRNFSTSKQICSNIIILREGKDSIKVSCVLGYKSSFVAIGNFQPKSGPRLLLATLPIYARMQIKNKEELWIIQCDDSINGHMCFYGKINVSGQLRPIFRTDGDISVISFEKDTGYARIENEFGSSLHIIALTGRDLLTFSPIFKSKHWDDDFVDDEPTCFFWGCYSMYINSNLDAEIQQLQPTTTIFCISDLQSPSFKESKGLFAESGLVTEFTSVFKDFTFKPILLKLVSTREVDFDKLEWTDLPLNYRGRPLLSPIDLCYNSGHVTYKIDFEIKCEIFLNLAGPRKDLTLDLNMRHRSTVFLNGNILGGSLGIIIFDYSLFSCII